MDSGHSNKDTEGPRGCCLSFTRGGPRAGEPERWHGKERTKWLVSQESPPTREEMPLFLGRGLPSSIVTRCMVGSQARHHDAGRSHAEQSRIERRWKVEYHAAVTKETTS